MEATQQPRIKICCVASEIDFPVFLDFMSRVAADDVTQQYPDGDWRIPLRTAMSHLLRGILERSKTVPGHQANNLKNEPGAKLETLDVANFQSGTLNHSDCQLPKQEPMG